MPRKLKLADLVGLWLKAAPEAAAKAAASDAAAVYPARLDLRADGHYRGEPEAGRQFTCWDVGTWSVEAGGHELKLSTANDARVRYAVTAWDGESFAVRDPQGLVLSYRRG